MAVFALFVLLVVFFAFSSDGLVIRLRDFVTVRPLARSLVLVGLLCIPYLLAALPELAGNPVGFITGLGIVLLYLLMPVPVLLRRLPGNRPFDMYDIAAILLLWFPIEFDLLPGTSAEIAGVGIPIARLTGICLGFLLFLVIRPVGRVGYTYRLNLRDILTAFGGLLGFMVVGLPFGLLVGFIQPGFATFDLPGWLLRFVAIYFFTAIPEELLFRGVIQNLIEQRWGRTWITLAGAAVIFGLSHINNSTAHHSPPNWLYVIMATFAGLAYGWVWRKREKITASAITHTLVNFIWGVVFRS